MEDFIKASNTMYQMYNETLANLDPIIFKSLIGTLIDTYENDHPDFSGEECLKDLLEVRDAVNEEVKNKTDEDMFYDLIALSLLTE